MNLKIGKVNQREIKNRTYHFYNNKINLKNFKAAEYYLQIKETIKKSRNQYKNLSKEEKDKIKEYQRKRYRQLIQYKKEVLQNK